MADGWQCPQCARAFTRKNQRHACGTGDRASVLRDRPPALVDTYADVEAYLLSLGGVEVVARDRYVLFRTARVLADVVMMKDAVRLAIHLGRKREHPAFIKIVSDRRHVTHVALLKTLADAKAMRPFLKDAHALSSAHAEN